jgi:hypothetical protein
MRRSIIILASVAANFLGEDSQAGKLRREGEKNGRARIILVYIRLLLQGWIYRGACTEVRAPVGLGQQGCKGGVQKNQIQKYGTIPNVFPFSKLN